MRRLGATPAATLVKMEGSGRTSRGTGLVGDTATGARCFGRTAGVVSSGAVGG